MKGRGEHTVGGQRKRGDKGEERRIGDNIKEERGRTMA